MNHDERGDLPGRLGLGDDDREAPRPPRPTPDRAVLVENLRPLLEQMEGFLRHMEHWTESVRRAQQQLQAQMGSIVAAQRLAEQRGSQLKAFAGVQDRFVAQFVPLVTAQQTWFEQFRLQHRAFEHFASILPKTDFAWVADLRRTWKAAMPPNWPEDIDYERLHVTVYEHGLPIVWVPRAEVLEEVLRQDERDERLRALREHQAEVVEDCAVVLAEVTHPRLAKQVPLARAAVDALREGHPEAAQALAVTVADSTIREFLDKKYGKVKELVWTDLDEVAIMRLRTVAALAPVHVFFREYWPGPDTAPPVALSRHVTIHMATVDHVHGDNALVAVMLLASLLRTFHEMASVAEAA